MPAMCLLLASFLCILFLAAIYFFRVRNVVKYRGKADSERPDIADADYLGGCIFARECGYAERAA